MDKYIYVYYVWQTLSGKSSTISIQSENRKALLFLEIILALKGTKSVFSSNPCFPI